MPDDIFPNEIYPHGFGHTLDLEATTTATSAPMTEDHNPDADIDAMLAMRGLSSPSTTNTPETPLPETVLSPSPSPQPTPTLTSDESSFGDEIERLNRKAEYMEIAPWLYENDSDEEDDNEKQIESDTDSAKTVSTTFSRLSTASTSGGSASSQPLSHLPSHTRFFGNPQKTTEPAAAASASASGQAEQSKKRKAVNVTSASAGAVMTTSNNNNDTQPPKRSRMSTSTSSTQSDSNPTAAQSTGSSAHQPSSPSPAKNETISEAEKKEKKNQTERERRLENKQARDALKAVLSEPNPGEEVSLKNLLVYACKEIATLNNEGKKLTQAIKAAKVENAKLLKKINSSTEDNHKTPKSKAPTFRR